MKKQRGFTIIEMIVVIALLGILGAVALPRFIDVTDDAHRASVEGTAGALSSAVALIRAQAIAQNLAPNSQVKFDGQALFINDAKLPMGAQDSSFSSDNCAAVWQGVLQANAPLVSSLPDTSYSTEDSQSPSCIYRYNKDGRQGDERCSIIYDTQTGNVSTANL